MVGWDSSLAALTPCECINGGVPIVSPGNVRTRDWENPALSLALSLSLPLSFKNLKGAHKNVNVSADECRLPGQMVDLVILYLLLDTTASHLHQDTLVERPGTAICPCMLHHICSPDLCSSVSERSQYPLAECLVAIIDNLSPSQEALNVLGNSQGPPRGRWKSHSPILVSSWTNSSDWEWKRSRRKLKDAARFHCRETLKLQRSPEIKA